MVARIIAVKKDSSGLDVAVFVAERCEWNSHLERPAASRDLRRRLPEEVRRGVLAGCVIEDRVVLDVARGDDEQLGGVTAVARVDKESTEVIESASGVVAIRIGCTNRLGSRVI